MAPSALQMRSSLTVLTKVSSSASVTLPAFSIELESIFFEMFVLYFVGFLLFCF